MASALLEEVVQTARAAGEEVLGMYGVAGNVQTKQDGSPVCEADQRSQAVICKRLARLDPGIPVVAEESDEPTERATADGQFWLVDPLDGTKEFLGQRDEFTINIALIDSGSPIVGVVFAPALGELFGAEAGEAFVQDAGGTRRVSARTIPPEGATVVSSRSHGDPKALARFEANQPIKASITIGSSLKFCLVATGKADLYPRFGRTMEWDTAAGDAVLRAAGGRVVDLAGKPLRYGKPSWENPFFVALGREAASSG